MKLNTAFIAAALLTSVIAAPLASTKPVNNVALETEKGKGGHVKADYIYRDVYRRDGDEEQRPKADYVYREVYKRKDDEPKHANADYVYREVY